MESYCVICRSPRRRAAPRHRKGLKSDMATNGSGQVFRFHRLRLLELGEAIRCIDTRVAQGPL
jgi:hypothetical protein